HQREFSEASILEKKALKPNLRHLGWAAMTAVSMTAAVGTAPAAGPYDGSWRVVINTSRGTCSSGGYFTLQIRNGIVGGVGGGVSVAGRVSGDGAVRVSVRLGEQHASGSGRLSGGSGSGSWRGVGSAGVCSGSWSASRG